jgi:hypothetical protein
MAWDGAAKRVDDRAGDGDKCSGAPMVLQPSVIENGIGLRMLLATGE